MHLRVYARVCAYVGGEDWPMTFIHHGNQQYVEPYPEQEIPWGRVRELPAAMVVEETEEGETM